MFDELLLSTYNVFGGTLNSTLLYCNIFQYSLILVAHLRGIWKTSKVKICLLGVNDPFVLELWYYFDSKFHKFMTKVLEWNYPGTVYVTEYSVFLTLICNCIFYGRRVPRGHGYSHKSKSRLHVYTV